ncbi:aminotransferase class I/II-fold pyridoxal phosphate-dependent enzyme [Curtobacterium flaccumfaciens pv. flaccumfaciens]
MIGSAAKVFWGGLRIGWIRADPALLQRLLLARPTGDLGTPVLDQLVVRELVPRTAAFLEARRASLREGRDAVVGALRARLPEWDVPAPAGGLTTWVGLGRPVSSALVLAARAEGVVLASGGVFGPDGGFERFLRVPFTMAPADRGAVGGRAVAVVGTGGRRDERRAGGRWRRWSERCVVLGSASCGARGLRGSASCRARRHPLG